MDDGEKGYEGFYVDDVRIIAPKSVIESNVTFTVNGLKDAAGIGDLQPFGEQGYLIFMRTGQSGP